MRALYTSVKNTWQDAENLDGTHGYTSYIWIPEETFKVDVLKLHVWAEKFRAHSKAALAGGATVVTSETTLINHTHNVVIGTKTSAGGGAHRHKMFELVGAYENYEDYKYKCMDVVQGVERYVRINVDSDRPLWTYEEVTDHTHDVVIGTVTSQSGGGSHSHAVTLPDHTHGIDFGIYEEAIAGRTLSAILYDPDGNMVKDFGVVCTGEDSVILDLSEYFETLKYGTWRLDLSASGRIRARLLYYELCKMYAQY